MRDPGARGFTPQSCAYRDSLAEFDRLGVTGIGISAQAPAEQRDAEVLAWLTAHPAPEGQAGN